MKSLISLIFLFSIATCSFAQAPQKMSYQAVIRNSSGTLVTSNTIGMRISIIQGSVFGASVYVETQTTSTNINGLASLEIGTGNVVVGSFSGINWGAGPFFIKTETDISGGTNYNIIGSSELLSVPYALFSANSTPGPQGIAGPAGPQGPAGIFAPGTAIGEMLYWNGSSWITIAPGISLPGNQVQTLGFCNGVPTWGPCPAILPTLTTTAISSISGFSAISGGDILNDGGAPITSRGICWSTTPSPTLTNSILNNGSGIGLFTSTMTGLMQNTTYYVRSFATNSVGTSYGNQLIFSTTVSTIGQQYMGGVIAYIDASGQHGLIAAPSDQSTGVFWHSSNSGIAGASGISIGTGNTNTNSIQLAYGLEINAAKICYDLILGGFSDWYLPSKDELNQLYINRVAIGGFINSGYWSSTEGPTNINPYATFQYFTGDASSGIQGETYKNSLFPIRAVRSF